MNEWLTTWILHNHITSNINQDTNITLFRGVNPLVSTVHGVWTPPIVGLVVSNFMRTPRNFSLKLLTPAVRFQGKIHHIRFWLGLGLCPKTPLGKLTAAQRVPRLPSWI